MNKYNKDSTCPKCGSQAPSTTHEKEKGESVMRRTCKTCRYNWNEWPLDHKEIMDV